MVLLLFHLAVGGALKSTLCALRRLSTVSVYFLFLSPHSRRRNEYEYEDAEVRAGGEHGRKGRAHAPAHTHTHHALSPSANNRALTRVSNVELVFGSKTIAGLPPPLGVVVGGVRAREIRVGVCDGVSRAT